MFVVSQLRWITAETVLFLYYIFIFLCIHSMSLSDLEEKRIVEKEDGRDPSSFSGDCVSIDSVCQGDEDSNKTDLTRSVPILHPSHSIPLDLDSYDCMFPSTVEESTLFRNYTSMSLYESASGSLSPMYSTYSTCPYVLDQDEEESELSKPYTELCDSGPVSLDCERGEVGTEVPHQQKYRYPCRDYEIGICNRGDRCKFYHDPSKRLPENVCFDCIYDA